VQAVSRRLAHHTFSHVLDLDISFHLERRTGQLSRVLERGIRATQTIFATIFTLLPSVLEVLLVAVTLGKLFNPAVVVAVTATFIAYVSWTARYIALSAAARKNMNDMDARSSGKAVDALLNYETVCLPTSPSCLSCACAVPAVSAYVSDSHVR
jgi:ABC-type transport system involved in Fe-S cluster assembly fused permease/ATPase subunit